MIAAFLSLALVLGAPLIYTKPPVPMRDKAVQGSDPNNPLTCSGIKLCSMMFASCRCDDEGICEEKSCEDTYIQRFCFCGWVEQPQRKE
jgi:hypothetical protein